MKLIINADDFGISIGTNYGIIEAHKNGIVSSTTLMVNMTACEHAINLAKLHPNLGLGIHFNLSKGFPLTLQKNLINEKGEFYKDYKKISLVSELEIETELRAQLNKFLSFGIEPSHFDSHHHVHFLPNVMNVVEKLAFEYNKPIRKAWLSELNERNFSKELKGNDAFGDFYGNDLTVESLKRIISSSEGEVLEVMCHPAFLDPFIYKESSYNIGRINEYSILTSEEIKLYIKENSITLINFNQI